MLITLHVTVIDCIIRQLNKSTGIPYKYYNCSIHVFSVPMKVFYFKGKLVMFLDKYIGMRLLRSESFSMLCTDLLLLVFLLFYDSVSPSVKMRILIPLLESFQTFIE